MTRAEHAVLTVENTRKTLPATYDVLLGELKALYDKNPRDEFGFGMDMYRFGFARGQRFEAAQQKKKRARV